MFFGYSMIYITCSGCQYSIEIPEKFLYLPLYINGIKGVEESLVDYFKQEPIEGFHCDECDETHVANKT